MEEVVINKIKIAVKERVEKNPPSLEEIYMKNMKGVEKEKPQRKKDKFK